MDMNDWVMLVTALGGIEGIKQLIKWWMSRKTNARIEDAHADVEEFKALREYNEFLQKQLSEKEQRFVEQTDRLRKAQDELFTLKGITYIPLPPPFSLSVHLVFLYYN